MNKLTKQKGGARDLQREQAKVNANLIRKHLPKILTY